MNKLIFSTLSFLSISVATLAAPNAGQPLRKTGLNKTASGCDETTAVIDMDINNVRARLMTGGDMWWDRPNGAPAYEVPKNSKKHALFAGSIWIGGKDNATGKTKVAAQTYRQSGNDYWTGPLDEFSSIDNQVCAEWDRFWKINATDVNKFRGFYGAQTDPQEIANLIQNRIDEVPAIIQEWPARGNNKVIGAGGNVVSYMPNREMAPFVDLDSNGLYDWRKGEYPAILGDQYIWWIFNDKGNIKTETTSEAIGLEIHAAAFAFATNDCINDATFYNYRVNNFSTSTLKETYMATWSDADLGNYADDYIGCDTNRGLGILYNGDANDEGVSGYGTVIPMVGIDYFQGPKYFDTAKNEIVELKMSAFGYFDNDASNFGNPSSLNHFYNYMTGFWKDGSPWTVSKGARVAGATPTKFVFPGDPCKPGTWSEVADGNTAFDRRFIHSAGPFSLIPGSEPNNITIGAVWVPNVGGGANACFGKIQVCDDIAQKLFDDDFKLPSGPNAPKVVIQPLDKKLVFDLDNLAESNNFNENYGTDPKTLEIVKKAKDNGYADSVYKFEGYIVYQLKNNQVSLGEIRNKDGSINTEKARLVFQCDVKNGVSTILNFAPDAEISAAHYSPRLMVTGKNEGIKHSFQLTEDAFAAGSAKNLVNYKTYYYVAVAYAHNNFKDFDPANAGFTQDVQYLESRTDGRKSPIQILTAMPHPATDSLYVQTYADYGSGVQLKRLEGKGNGGNALELTEESEMEALKGPDYHAYFPTYKPNAGPVNIKVVNPDSIKAGNYEVVLKVADYYTTAVDTSLGARPEATTWYILNKTTGDTIFSNFNVSKYNEQYLRKYLSKTNTKQLDWGLMAAVEQVRRPGDRPIENNNGLISSDIIFDVPSNNWLSGVVDQDGNGNDLGSYSNWIRAGRQTNAADNPDCSMIDWDNSEPGNIPTVKNKDYNGFYEKVAGGTWAPYNLVANVNKAVCGFGLMYGTQTGGGSIISNTRLVNRLEEVYSIDVVFTSDKSKWSKCPVIEMTENTGAVTSSEGGAFKYNLRKHQSWTGNVDANGKPIYDNNEVGMSYFPGYAINQETGERLNIVFGEESFNTTDNGADMIWNPTSRLYEFNNEVINRWGGKHIIYVSRTKYDGGQFIKSKLESANNTSSAINEDLKSVYNTMMWVGAPLLRENFSLLPLKDGLIPTDARVKIRVSRPYTWYNPGGKADMKNNGWPRYEFTTDGIAPALIGDAANNYTNNKDEVLKRILAVPNPYYAVSSYETTSLDTRIKIINLPEKATIKIFTLDGALIRTINKNDAKTNYVDWDLKNSKNIPIVSGMYLIHVQLPGIGETVVKWFGAMRPVDITNF